MADLESVIERVQHRDARAFEVLVDTYSGRLYGFLYRLTGSTRDAEDLVQEVFVRVVRMIGQYQHQDRSEAGCFGSWNSVKRIRSELR